MSAVMNEHREDLTPLRLTRVNSWLDRARATDLETEKFLFYWIAFNAAYANATPEASVFTERDIFNHFIDRIVERDKEGQLDQVLWNIFPNHVRILMSNKYSCLFFWADQMSEKDQYDWREAMEKECSALNRAFSKGDTAKVLKIIFGRLYVLRNRIVHGGMIFENSYNQKILENAAWLMESVMTEVVKIMSDPQYSWGLPLYSLRMGDKRIHPLAH